MVPVTTPHDERTTSTTEMKPATEMTLPLDVVTSIIRKSDYWLLLLSEPLAGVSQIHTTTKDLAGLMKTGSMPVWVGRA